jgi:hypothetical protein
MSAPTTGVDGATAELLHNVDRMFAAIEAAASRLVAEIDGIIAATVGHELLSAAEVADMMLDLRSTASAIAQAAQA